MNQDWKEKLNALRNSGEIPADDSPIINEPEPKTDEKKKFVLNVVTDKKGRKGKTATIIEGLGDNDAETEELAKLLKQKLGTGGSWRTGEILLQGDCKTAAIDILKKSGYKIK